MTPRALRLPLALAVCTMLLAGCEGVFPAEMDRQPSLGPLMAPRPPPEGAVPVGGVEHLDDREDAEDLANPLAADPTAAPRGEELFAIHCAICHAADGRGNGKLSKVFPPAPDLLYRTICARTDGFIYGTLTAGGRAMPSMREGLSSRDRWALVSFVRRLQSKGCTNTPPAGSEPGVAPPTDGAPPTAPAPPGGTP